MSSEKGALALLSCYGGGDSSDDEIPACRVSVKRIHKDSGDDDDFGSKNVERLPLPALITQTASKRLHVEDPALHGGRTRSFPHERGNWATYVFIPYEPSQGVSALIELVLCGAPVDLELKQVEDLHISLTKTVVLKHHWIDAFVGSVKEKLHFPRFILFFDALEVYCNEEHTRTFIGLQIKTGYDSLTNIVRALDECLLEFKQPKFYENPSFHLSIFWALGDRRSEIASILPEMNAKFHELTSEFSQENWYLYVNYVNCKIGYKMYNFPLS